MTAPPSAATDPGAPAREYLLTLSCPDRRGIVYAVSGFLAEWSGNILDAQQYGDPDTGQFFLRVHVAFEDPAVELAQVRSALAELAAGLAMSWQLTAADATFRLLVLVSREGHCLNDLIFRAATGSVPARIVAVVSNHRDLEPLAAAAGIPFHHLPVTPATKPDAERALLRLVDQLEVDLVVLARYMQVLSGPLCEALGGRAINIHHGLLPSFQGPRPYHQAHARGVKLVGATAHYVTAELDQGPIIEQEVARVDHAMGPAQLAAVGKDLECVALARAVRWHLERRVLLNGERTVVFR